MLTLDSPAFQELRRDFNEWLPHIVRGEDKFVPASPIHREPGEAMPVGIDPLVTAIMAAVARRAACKVEDLRGPRRSAVYARPRFIAYLLISELVPRMSLPQIGKAMDRDHTTIMYGIKRAKAYIADSDAWRAFYEEVKGEF